jgi:hypothetical protein
MATFKPTKHVTIGNYGPSVFPLSYKLPRKELENHGHVIGQSKSGKSRFLASLYIQLLQAGYSVTIIDPAGDLAKLILATLISMGYFDQPKAFDKLTYLDIPCAERLDLFMPFNVLDSQRPSDKVASNIKDAFHRAWPELSHGAATFDTLLPDAVMLLHHNNLPLIALHTLLNNEQFRQELLDKETDYFLVSSFADSYNEFKKMEQQIYAGSVLRRARQLTQVSLLKYGLGQSKNLLNFRTIMDENRSLLVNLGGLDPDATSLLGCLLTTAAEQSALSRADLPSDARLTTHFLMIDEFSQFSEQSEAGLSRILSLTRKYGLYLIMAHQTWSQASNKMRGALQNAGYEAIFKTGPDDAAFSAPYVSTFDPELIKHEVTDSKAAERTHPSFLPLAEQDRIAAQSIRDLKRRQFYFRAPSDQVVHLKTVDFPDPKIDKSRLQEVERYYLSTCFRPKQDVEKEIYAFTWGRHQNNRATNKPAFMSYIESNDEGIDS